MTQERWQLSCLLDFSFAESVFKLLVGVFKSFIDSIFNAKCFCSLQYGLNNIERQNKSRFSISYTILTYSYYPYQLTIFLLVFMHVIANTTLRQPFKQNKRHFMAFILFWLRPSFLRYGKFFSSLYNSSLCMQLLHNSSWKINLKSIPRTSFLKIRAKSILGCLMD